ncbi:MAG TPA: hypothetical protein VFB06_00995 [Streptosporangiaceae bacterium]|nr:hypothetical protein [Streptosporangiaceae bacterium]
MGLRPLTMLLATAAVTAAALATGTSASAATSPPDHGFPCSGYGTGSTLQAAQLAARQDFIGNETVGQLIYTNGQFPDGSWWAEITGDCVFQR